METDLAQCSDFSPDLVALCSEACNSFQLWCKAGKLVLKRHIMELDLNEVIVLVVAH